jgi:nitrite reductase (NADH) small subunit
MMHDVGAPSDFPEGECRILVVEGLEIGIYNIEGRFYAIRNLCPHRGAPVCKGELRGTMLPSEPGEYVPAMAGQVLHCPWHQWEFDLATGRTLFGTDKRRLITYAVTTQGGRMLISVPPAKRTETSVEGTEEDGGDAS